MKTRTVPSTWVNRGGRRFDASPYASGALDARIRLETLDVPKNLLRELTVGGLSGLVNPGRIKRLWVSDPSYGRPFLSSTDILQADLSTVRHISHRAVAENPRLLIGEGWTLITRAGTIGRMAYARPDMDGMACTEDVLRVIPDVSVVPAGYLFAFLSGRFGVPLVTSGTYGAIIQHIEPQHVADIPVPRLGASLEEKAHELVTTAASQLASYQSLIQAATEAVMANAGAWNPTPTEWHADGSDLGFSVGSNQLHTMRAWNHSRKAARIRQEIQGGSWSRLADVIDMNWIRWRKQFQRFDADPEYGLEVITQKPLFRLFPEGRWISKKYLLGLSSKYLVPDRTILIAKQGTLGEGELYCRCEYISGERALARAYSDHCMRVVANKEAIHPGYLFAFLRSEAAFRLLRSLSEGAKQQDLHWRTVPELPVPRCTPEEEQRIGAMVDQAYAVRNEAVDKMLEARAIVEYAIEEAH
ncbi:methylation-associated defense system restriction endonuclease subunit S MAD5 [Verrucosispora sp. WMMD703]|uniref:methylation-associated defense system restriction endonuclease subunit S MAD5 n=1 Tax=Verrucosispora sp. WMMD703 TaxID=3403463 RepID=UPI003B95C27C